MFFTISAFLIVTATVLLVYFIIYESVRVSRRKKRFQRHQEAYQRLKKMKKAHKKEEPKLPLFFRVANLGKFKRIK